MGKEVLVVEDDPAVRRGLGDALRFAGYCVTECAEGEAAAAALKRSSFDLVLLDVMLPGRDGFSLLADLRRSKRPVPVILVTARGAEEDRVRGLLSGADDYVVKPFSAKELLARVEAVLRRCGPRSPLVKRLRTKNLLLDLERREALGQGGAALSLTEKEVDLLAFLATHAGRAVSREELLRAVWQLEPRGLETRTVDMLVARLREKLQQLAPDPVLLTVRGQGYALAAGVLVAEEGQ